MNRTIRIIFAVFLLAALMGCGRPSSIDLPVTGALVIPEFVGELSGRFVRTEDGTMLLVANEYKAIELNTEMDLSGLNTGDWITIYHDGLTKSVPAKTFVKECMLLQKGSAADLSKDDEEQIAKLGFIIC